MKKAKNQHKKAVRALVLFSGGLDSRIVVKLLQDQNIETELLYFNLPFGCGCCNNLECNFNFSQMSSAKLRIMDCNKGELFKKYMKIIRDPKYGYGRALNPCIHCRIFMLEEAKKIMKKEKFDFIATGEVIGQRPMSQYRAALDNIEKESGLEGEILRPLSAKLLEPTKAEKKCLVNREKLLGLNGRGRNTQLELAKKYNIKFPTPSGGCLLCDKAYSVKLKDLLKHKKTITFDEILTLKGFRHFRSKGKIILGKNHEDNLKLQSLAKKIKYNLIISPSDIPGPTAIYEDKRDKQLVESLIKAFSSKNLEERNRFEDIRIKAE